MKKTDYNNVKELGEMLEWGMVSFETKYIGSGDSGISVSSLTDLKSGTLYIEQYDPNTDSLNVYSFPKGQHPKMWKPEEGGRLEYEV